MAGAYCLECDGWWAQGGAREPAGDQGAFVGALLGWGCCCDFLALGLGLGQDPWQAGHGTALSQPGEPLPALVTAGACPPALLQPWSHPTQEGSWTMEDAE